MDNKWIDKINKIIGKEIVIKGDEQLDIKGISTGIIGVDYLTGIGGFPLGRSVDITGLPGSGKTSLCLQTIANAQRQGIKCAFIDAEFTFEKKHAELLGVDLNKLVLVKPDYGEEAFEVLEALLKDKYGLIVVDSTASLVTKAEKEAEMGTPPMARQARLISQAMRKVTSIISKKNACVIYISQVRTNMMSFSKNPYTSTGGKALEHYTSLRLQLTRTGSLTQSSQIVGNQIKVKVLKTKLTENKGEMSLNYYFQSGFEVSGGLFEVAEAEGVIQKDGNRRFFEGNLIGGGKDQTIKFLEDNPIVAEKILQVLLGNVPPNFQGSKQLKQD